MSNVNTNIEFYPEQVIKAAHTGNFPVLSIDIDWEVIKDNDDEIVAILPKINIKYDT